jgi:predicted nucleic acid-binding protein
MILDSMDAMVFIYAIKRCKITHPPKDHDLRNRTLILLNHLDKENVRIVLPSVVVSEILAGIPHSDHGRTLSKLTQRFHVAPLDVAAASLAAEVWIKHRGLPKSEQMARNLLKVDSLVVATAKIGGARNFYSHDEGCRKLSALAGLVPKDLPTHSTDLLLDAELRTGSATSGLESEEESGR